jgi:DNA-3-methyladenine glycosylase II
MEVEEATRLQNAMKIQPPYDFVRSMQVLNRFSHAREERDDGLKIGLRMHDQPIVISVRTVEGRPEELAVTASARAPKAELEAAVRWVLFDEFDLAPFYRLVEKHLVLGPVVRDLWGVKPMRPASLFEMAVTVITEQQISLAAASRIRVRLTERFGDQVDDVWVFPAAVTLAQSTLDDIVQCGYSHRKAEYIQDFAARVAGGSLNLDAMKTLPEADVYQQLVAIRGWGPWSANYFLIRGLARPDSVPADDLAVRSVVGKYLGEGERASAALVESLLEPYRPFRGMVAFYLLAHVRLEKARQRNVVALKR